jgi:hypothetical protein
VVGFIGEIHRFTYIYKTLIFLFLLEKLSIVIPWKNLRSNQNLVDCVEQVRLAVSSFYETALNLKIGIFHIVLSRFQTIANCEYALKEE